MANVDTDAKIIDTVEFTGLEDNQEYYLKSALVGNHHELRELWECLPGCIWEGCAANRLEEERGICMHAMDERFSIQNASSTETYSGTLTLEVRFVVDLRTANTGHQFQEKRHSLAALVNPETGKAGKP